jgi:hypothetical protein
MSNIDPILNIRNTSSYQMLQVIVAAAALSE